jgi:hypothetical protein
MGRFTLKSKARSTRSETGSFVSPPDETAVRHMDNDNHDKNISEVKLQAKPQVTDAVDANVNSGVLAGFYPFNLLDRQLLRRVESSLKEVKFEPRQVVLRQGDTSDRSVYLIKSGRFEAVDMQEAEDVSRHGPAGRHVSMMIAGTFFGERSSLFGLPRSRQVCLEMRWGRR